MVPYSRVAFILWDKDAGDALRRIRDSKKLSRPELSALTKGKVSMETITSIELGRKKTVSTKILNILLTALGCSIESIFPTVTVKNF